MKTKFIRNGKTITNIETNKSEQFKFTNEAKRRSRELQMQNGGLGRGSVMLG